MVHRGQGPRFRGGTKGRETGPSVAKEEERSGLDRNYSGGGDEKGLVQKGTWCEFNK